MHRPRTASFSERHPLQGGCELQLLSATSDTACHIRHPSHISYTSHISYGAPAATDALAATAHYRMLEQL